MRKKNVNSVMQMIMLFSIIFAFQACKEDPVIETVDITIQLQLPESLEGVRIHSVEATLENKANMADKKTVKGEQADLQVTLTPGTYNITLTGKLTYQEEGKEVTTDVDGSATDVIFNNEHLTTKIPVYIKGLSSGLILKELFTMGSTTADEKSYRQDKYFIIYNNSDQVIYADSVAICESEFSTIQKRENLTPVIFDDYTPVRTMYMIPGSGKDHPLKPGEQLILADVAKDHSKIDPGYIDLSKADFEWYDDHKLDEDVPTVPNLEKIFSYSKTIWTPHVQGYHGYFIAKIQQPTDAILKDLKYDYSYTILLQGETKTQTKTGFKIPNSWVLDGVNHTMKATFQWLVMSPTIDRGYTWAKESSIKEHTGVGVIRKKMYEIDGRIIYQDTNNSSEDFIPATKPSLRK